MNRWPGSVQTSSFALLGRLEVRRAGKVVLVPGPMARTVLTLLLLSRGEVVSTDRLAEALWGRRQPVSATASVRNHVLRIRQSLGEAEPDAVQTRAGGYLIDVAPGNLDLDVFADLCDSGRRALRQERWEQAAGDLTAALALWRGEPLADLPDGAAPARREQLREARLLAFEGRTEARLRMSRHQEAITDLCALTAEHPLREGFHGQLMLALYRSGRQAEALEVFRALRRTLVEDLAVEPSGELRELHRRILMGDPQLDAPIARTPLISASPTVAAARGCAPTPSPTPAQLPAPVGDFAGRQQEVSALVAAVAATDHRRLRPPVAVLTGGGGIGKTTLAVQVAHLLAELFPDGRLFVDLHGMDAAPRDPGQVLAQWLRDLGVAAGDVPHDPEARAARFRTLTHDRRILLVLDNARNVRQIEPLLPAAPGCAVLVTSRDRLAELPGCTRLELRPLPDSEALTLLEEIVGTDRIRAEPQAAGDILAACAGLPLALRIAGSRLNARHRWSVRKLAARLADQRHRLTELRIGDLAARASFQVSYQALPDGPTGTPARLFRLLGVVTAPDIDAGAAAALADTSVSEAEDALEVLVDAHLLHSPVPGRFQAHDLLRVFAGELAQTEHSPDERQDAAARLVSWYTDTTAAAIDIVTPGTVHWGLPESSGTHLAPPSPDAEACWEWLLAERTALSAAVSLAEDALPGPEAWILAALLLHFYNRRGLFADLYDTHMAGLRCADRCDDALGRSRMLTGISHAAHNRGDFEEALDTARGAMEAAEHTADPRLVAAACANYATALGRMGRTDEAVGWHSRSISVMREIGNPEVLAATLLNFAIELIRLDRHREADEALDEALPLARDRGSSFMHASVLRAQARCRHEQGGTEEAIGLLVEADSVYSKAGNQASRAGCQEYLGECLVAVGRPDEARTVWTRAIALLDELGDVRAGELRRRVQELVA